ncbi:MAG: bifunctional UDP-N-acetylglucosamine diphosphorylase/glucosamine-1-phosphate N-acetyltransferase GlmU [Polyangiaceae bacterium]|nr:bifunctional UDP-N-acetylglucosamine diphosphorylase/glucosamine-1-phosphate N-acetyltransferase GlmU [Polyangiaceae bacterium]
MATVTAIVLAAGQGTRMKSGLSKVMHRVCGLPIVHYGVAAALAAGCDEVVVVVGHGRAEVEAYLARAFAGARVRTAHQEEQRGTGDAARVGLAAVGEDAARVLIVNGDVPLVQGDDLRRVVEGLGGGDALLLALATCMVDDPTGYGRVLRRGRSIAEVREHRDLESDEQHAVREINAGVYAGSLRFFREAIAALVPNNAQGELYLTDVVAFAARAGRQVVAVNLGADVLAGVNDRQQLAEVEAVMQSRLVRRWRLAGATVRDGARLDATVVLDRDVTIESGAALRGATRVARGATVDVGCVLTDVEVGEEARLKPYTVATSARIGARAQIGPFAHLRPESDVGEEAHLGNFVETKNTSLGKGAKANHLAYLGDGVIGDNANVGAGTIFCNYDGVQKHTTRIGAGAFIGSDSQLVAPVTIGAGAYVGTGTTVTRDVPAEALALSRVKQENKEGYAPKLRARLLAAKQAKTAK